jgi:cysteine dioxygenase
MTLLSDCISPVIRSIREPSCEQLIDALLSLQVHRELLAEDIPLPIELPYGRKVLYASEDVELILVHLPANADTRIHDHGQSVGAALVLEGQLINVIYHKDHAGHASPIGEQRAHSDELFLAERNQIHQMRNPHSERVVSLHLYSPPLSGVQVYD